MTDYEIVCRHLGIETIYAHSPQAKGRIVRLNKTLQGRWPHQFAYEGITDIEQANAHIPFGQSREHLHRIRASWSEKNLWRNLSFSQNKKRFEVLIKEEKMRYRYPQILLVYYEKENRYEILYPLRKNQNTLVCHFK